MGSKTLIRRSPTLRIFATWSSGIPPKPEPRLLIVELLRRLRKSPLFERSQSAVVKLTVVHRGASFGFEELEQFRTWHQQLATKGATNLQFPALNQAIDAEIVHAQHLSGFLN